MERAMKRVPYIFLMMLFALLTLSGCGGKKGALDGDLVQTYAADSAKKEEISQLNQQLFASAQVNVDPSDYLLGAGDLIHVTVFEAKDLESKVRVSSRGYVTLPLLGQVQVKGLSAREAEEKIEQAYREKYIKDPHVSIFVEEHFSQRVTLVGQFKNPGTYDYLSKMRLLDVMALAGGLSDNAGRIVQVRRMSTSQEKQGMFLVDLDKLIKEGNTALNIEINGGDVIFVPEAGVFFVDGAVRKPGSYPIKQKTTVTEALVAAGGFAPYAKKDHVTLVRYVGDGERKVIELNMEEAQGQTEVQDRDVIIAQESAFGKLIYGTGINLGIPGLFGFGYRDPAR